MNLRMLPFWPVVIIGTSLAVSLSAIGEWQSPLRWILALGFLVICPGMAYVPLLRLNSPSAELPIGIALSLAMDTIVAASALYLRAWHPESVLAVLVSLALAGAFLQIWQMRSHSLSGVNSSRIKALSAGVFVHNMSPVVARDEGRPPSRPLSVARPRLPLSARRRKSRRVNVRHRA